MKNARALGVGGHWLGFMKDALYYPDKLGRQDQHVSSPDEHSRAAANSKRPHFLNSDFLQHRGVPIAVVVLLIVIVVLTLSTFFTNAQKTKQTMVNEMSLLSEVISGQLEKDQSFEAALSSPTLAEVFLSDAVLGLPTANGRSIYLINKAEKVVAQVFGQDKYLNVTMSRLTGPEYAGKTDHTTVESIKFDGSASAFAIYRPIELVKDKPIGGILVVQNAKAAFAQWRSAVIRNTCLLLGFSMALLIILYVYVKQVAQSNATDQLYLETNARFDTALSRGHCGLWDWDLARGRIVWSSSMYHMLGLAPRDGIMSYGELVELVHPHDLDLMELANHAFSQKQGNVDRRFRMLHSSGSWVWMRIRAELVRHKESNPHLIGIAVDISEQEAIKRRSRDADIRLRDAIDSISEAFVLWDSNKRLVMCNSKYQQLYDLPTEAVKSGTLHQDVMQDSRKPRARHQVSTGEKLENGTKTFEAEIEDGRWLQISERRTLDGGFVSVGTDITQIKRNQEKLEQSERLQMETIADLRTTQQKLERQAQKLVEFADNLNEEKKRSDAGNRAKSEFLANISHELRTPLNAIIGFSDIMRTKMFGPLGSDKYIEYADDIHHSGSFLLGVINDILDMSKIEAGRFLLNPEPVQLDELLDETVRIIKVQADEANITVSQKIPKSLELEADRRAVKQVLLNLLSNSVKFTEKNGRIDVTAKHLKDSVNIVIKDNGIGIASDALERLAQPFEQVQDQFTKNHKGSGLGLAIARSLAVLHGGSLKISSTPGKGTTVAVRLPIKCKVVRPAEDEEKNDEGKAA